MEHTILSFFLGEREIVIFLIFFRSFLGWRNLGRFQWNSLPIFLLSNGTTEKRGIFISVFFFLLFYPFSLTVIKEWRSNRTHRTSRITLFNSNPFHTMLLQFYPNFLTFYLFLNLFIYVCTFQSTFYNYNYNYCSELVWVVLARLSFL